MTYWRDHGCPLKNKKRVCRRNGHRPFFEIYDQELGKTVCVCVFAYISMSQSEYEDTAHDIEPSSKSICI